MHHFRLEEADKILVTIIDSYEMIVSAYPNGSTNLDSPDEEDTKMYKPLFFWGSEEIRIGKDQKVRFKKTRDIAEVDLDALSSVEHFGLYRRGVEIYAPFRRLIYTRVE